MYYFYLNIILICTYFIQVSQVMTECWKIMLNETNAKLLSKDEFSNGFNPYEGSGAYLIDIPANFYKDSMFNFTAHLNAPNSPNGMKCTINYCSQVNCQTPSGNPNMRTESRTMMIGYNGTFVPGTTVTSSKDNIRTLNYPSWKACILVLFLVPVDRNSDKLVCPEKDWNLTLDFKFENMNAIRENIRLEKEKKLREEHEKREEEELQKIRLIAKMQAEEKLKVEMQLKNIEQEKRLKEEEQKKEELDKIRLIAKIQAEEKLKADMQLKIIERGMKKVGKCMKEKEIEKNKIKKISKNELDNLKVQGLKDYCVQLKLNTTKCQLRKDYIELLLPHVDQ